MVVSVLTTQQMNLEKFSPIIEQSCSLWVQFSITWYQYRLYNGNRRFSNLPTIKPLAHPTNSIHPLADQTNSIQPLADQTDSIHPLADQTDSIHPLTDQTDSIHPLADQTDSIQPLADPGISIQQLLAPITCIPQTPKSSKCFCPKDYQDTGT